MLTELCFVIAPGNPEPPLALLESSIRELKGILEEVGSAVTERRSGWRVTYIGKGSIKLGVAPPISDKSEVLLSTLIRGFESFEKSSRRPPYFSLRAVRSVRRLAAIGSRYGISLSADSNPPIEIGEAVVRHATESLRPKRHGAGSVLGRLDAISVHNRKLLFIYGVRGAPVECLVNDELLEAAKALLGGRVLAHGTVYETSRGEFTKIEAKEIFRLRESTELPQVRDIFSLLPDFTGGLSSTEHVRRLRDAAHDA